MEKNGDVEIDAQYRIETKLAALLHDIGHGPFSHTSESVYEHHSHFSNPPDRFLDADESEILSHCLIKSEPLQTLLDDFVYQSDKVDDVNSDRISDMILGNEDGLPDDYKFLRDIINGPFDADKFDYINRDGYYTGLGISLDVPRILQGLEISADRKTILVNFKSLSALEQVYIAKSQLYSRVYHHHKIRAAATIIKRLFELLELRDEKPFPESLPGHSFDTPATYLLVDETHILGREWEDNSATKMANRLKRRDLPRRALVLSHSSFPETREGMGSPEDVDVNYNWGLLQNDLGDNPMLLKEEQHQIETRSRAEGSVYIDIPPELPGDFDKARPKIKLGRGEGEVRDMSSVFPADSWENTYETYRQRNYIFTDAKRESIPAITDGALRWLSDKNITVHSVSVEDAKIDLNDIEWAEFINL